MRKSKRTKRRTNSDPMHRRRPLFEGLEDRRLLAVAPIQLEDIAAPNPIELNGDVLFFSSQPETGSELWKSDGSVGGASLVKDINPGSESSLAGGNLAVLNGKLYFGADDGTHGYELWVTDGTTAGTQLVSDIVPGPDGSRPSDLAAFNNTLIFSASTPATGNELWSTDGTAAGTQLLADIRPGADGSSPLSFLEFNGELLFNASDGVAGRELWKTDGTPGGTVLVKDINAGSSDSISPYYSRDFFTEAGGEVFFFAWNGTEGSELWKTDGTASGTRLVKDIFPGYGGSANYATSRRPMHEFEDQLFFAADDGSHGMELWTSDGTEGGTVLVKDINPGSESSLYVYSADLADYLGIFEATNLEQEFLFVARNSATGTELWKSDGTTGGTQVVKDINPGGSDSFSYDQRNLRDGQPLVVRSGDAVYFTPVIGPNFSERALWRTDGSEAGTFWVEPTGYTIDMTDVDGTLYFNQNSYAEAPGLYRLGSSITVSADSASIAAEEGQMATNTGVVADLNGAAISLSASVGTVTNNGDGTWSWSLDTTDGPSESDTVTITAADGSGDTQTDSFAVRVDNVDPAISMVTSKVIINEGTTASRAIAVTDVAADVVSVSASFGTLSSTGPDSWLWSYEGTDDLGVTRVVITATDEDGGRAESSFDLKVENVPPVATLSGPNNGVTGQNRKFTLEASDPSIVDQNAGFTFEIDWNGDRQFDETLVGPNGMQVSHAFLAAGTYTVYLKATDKDSETATNVSATSIVIAASRMQGENLLVGGTSADDTIQFLAGPNPEDVEVILNGISQGVYQPTGELRAFGEEGNDTIEVDAAISLPSYLKGDAGNDILRGGSGPDRLIGGAGDDQLFGRSGDDLLKGGKGLDTLTGGADNDELLGGGDADTISGGGGDDILRGGGGADVLSGGAGADVLLGQGGKDTLNGNGGRDIVIGGNGKDSLLGGGGSDILIGGSTVHDDNNVALLALLAEWNSSNSYNDRVANLRDGTGATPGLNGVFYLNAGTTVSDDNKQDSLSGGSGRDWIFAYLPIDLLSDLESNELVENL